MTARRRWGRDSVRLVGSAAVLLGVALLANACTSSSKKHEQPVTSTVRLVGMPEGTATVRLDAKTGEVFARLHLTGLQLRSRHIATLGEGTCSTPGRQVVAFRTLFANPAGEALGTVSSTSKVRALPATAHLTVAAGPGPSAADRVVIACGDLQAGGRATISGAGKVEGTVALSWSAKKLAARLHFTGLPAHSAHAVHVHFGTCATQSGVEVSLGDVTADAAGRVDVARTVAGIKAPLGTNGWYVDIHDGPSSSLVRNGQPTLRLRPLACGNAPGR